MRCLLSYILIGVALLAAAAACGRHSHDAQLDAAESLIGIDNDSALSILDSLPAKDLEGERLARYAYLRGKAEYRKHGCPLSDSLVELAAEYYYGTGDSIEAQTAFLRGIVCSYAGSSDSALVFLHHAYDLASADSSWFYAGVSARELCRVYCKTLLTHEELKWGLKAKECFYKGNLPVYANWMDFMLIRAYERNGRYEDALAVYAGIDSALFADAPYFRQQVLKSVAKTYSDMGAYENVISIYDSLVANGYKPNAHDNCRISEAYYERHDYAKAQEHLENLKTLRQSSYDSLYANLLQARIMYASGKRDSAYKILDSFTKQLISHDEFLLTHPQTGLLLDNYKLTAEKRKTEAENKRLYIQLLIFSCIIIATIASYLIWRLRKRMARTKEDIELFFSEITTLKKDLCRSRDNENELTGQITTLKQYLCQSREREDELSHSLHSLAESKEQREIEFRKELRNVFSRQITMLDDLCQISFRNDGTNQETRLHKEVMATIRKLQDLDLLEQLTGIIDRYNDGWMSRFKERYTDLTKNEYMLVMYLYLGFHTETIAVLTGKMSTKAVHTAKYRLKLKLFGPDGEDNRFLARLFAI